MGDYHLIHSFAEYTTMPMGLAEENPQTIPAVCQAVLTRFKDGYCNVSIANPDWDKDWCEPCIAGVAWNNELTAKWQAKGLPAKAFTDYVSWVRTPEGEYARASFQTYIEMTQKT